MRSRNIGICQAMRIAKNITHAAMTTADLLVNAGLGFGVGVVASVLLFRRRGWPVALSTGFGAGVAYSNCNFALNPYVLPGTKVLPAQQRPS
ncbi:MICOS complex subunit MIC10, partial [Tremellales sp. Uapishka_1]